MSFTSRVRDVGVVRVRNVDSTPDDEGDDVDVGRRTVRYRRSRRVAPMDDGLRTTSMAGGG